MLATDSTPGTTKSTNPHEALWAVDFRSRVVSIAKDHWLETENALKGLTGSQLVAAKRKMLSQYTDVPGYSSLDAPCSDFVTDVLQDAGSASFPARPETDYEKLAEVNVSAHYDHLRTQGWVHAEGYFKMPVANFRANLLPDSDRPLGCLAYYHRPTNKSGDIGHVGVIVGFTEGSRFIVVDASGMPYKGRLMLRNLVDPEIVDGTYDRITILCPPLGD